MAYTAPRTWVTGELVTASMMNTHVRDNFDALKTPPAGVATWSTNFTTTSTSFVDLTSATHTITSTGGGFLVILLASIANSSLGASNNIDIVVDGVSESGLTSGVQAWGQEVANAAVPICVVFKVPAKSAGSHTIKAQVRVSAGTMTVYGTASNVEPQFYVVEFGA